MEIKNFKTAQDIMNEIAGYEKKLSALDDGKLSINLIGNQNILMTVGATVENESLYGVLAVEFIDAIRKDLKNKILSLQKQLAAVSDLNYSKLSEGKNAEGLRYGLKDNPGIHLRGVFNNIMNFFSLF